MRTVITGEAVALDLPAVSLITRGAALLLDLVIYWAVLFGAYFFLGIVTNTAMDPAAQAALGLGATVLFLVIVPITVETLSRGRSVGKLAFGIRVVRDDGGAVRLRHCVIRGLAGFGEIYMTLGLVPLLTAMFTERGLRLGDVLAGTYAVRVRHTKVNPMMLPVPPHMAAWTQIADIGRVPDDLAAQSARLLRNVESGGRSANRQALTAVGDQLAHQMVAHVSPAPPTTSSIDFLAAVMAERRNREYQRLTHQQRRSAHLQQRIHALPYT